MDNGFDEDAKCILLHLKGQPSRSTRRLLKRLNEELKINVCTFTDGDPWSFRIHASVAYGAIKTAHISEYLATPTAEFVGITASDILNYELPTDTLTPRGVGALNAEMTDHRFDPRATAPVGSSPRGARVSRRPLAEFPRTRVGRRRRGPVRPSPRSRSTGGSPGPLCDRAGPRPRSARAADSSTLSERRAP